MQLRYISVPALIAEAGGDPWAINNSPQAGVRPRSPIWRRPLTLRDGALPNPTTPSKTPVVALRLRGIGRMAITRLMTLPRCSG